MFLVGIKKAEVAIKLFHRYTKKNKQKLHKTPKVKFLILIRH